MKIAKGTKLKIEHSRKGSYFAVAIEDFDTQDEWFPVAVAEQNGKPVHGMATGNKWEPGEIIPCRGSFVSNIEVVQEPKARKQRRKK
jgi:hypothetical protein